MIKKIRQLGLISALLFAFMQPCLAQENESAKQVISVIQDVLGTVTDITEDHISVMYLVEDDAEFEILLPIDKDVKLIHKQKLGQIKVGDTVRVQYREDSEDTLEGTIKKRKGLVISFVKPAIKKPEPQEIETDILNSR